jgi:hypothetical protein
MVGWALPWYQVQSLIHLDMVRFPRTPLIVFKAIIHLSNDALIIEFPEQLLPEGGHCGARHPV